MKKKIMMTMGLAAALIVTGCAANNASNAQPEAAQEAETVQAEAARRQKVSRKQKPAQARTHLSLHRIRRQPGLKNMRAATDGVFLMTAPVSN